MAEDPGEKQEEKFEFTREGEGVGYISLDQARVLAMRTARETPGAYWSGLADVPMAFEVMEAEETEDHYVITLSLHPQGEFVGRQGREQFFIETGIPQIKPTFLGIAPSGIPSNIIPHSKGVKCGLIRSNSPFSYSNHRPAKPKIPKPLVYAQVSPLGTSFATP